MPTTYHDPDTDRTLAPEREYSPSLSDSQDGCSTDLAIAQAVRHAHRLQIDTLRAALENLTAEADAAIDELEDAGRTGPAGCLRIQVQSARRTLRFTR